MAYHDLDKLTAAMNDLELRLNNFKVAMAKNKEEIALMIEYQKNLNENITELKKQNITVSANEFKKIKEDLKRVTIRISFLNMDKATYEKAYAGQCKLYDHLFKLHATEVERQNNNVVKIDFGSKNGR